MHFKGIFKPNVLKVEQGLLINFWQSPKYASACAPYLVSSYLEMNSSDKATLVFWTNTTLFIEVTIPSYGLWVDAYGTIL